jgi:hypothetical protein
MQQSRTRTAPSSIHLVAREQLRRATGGAPPAAVSSTDGNPVARYHRARQPATDPRAGV